MSLDIASSSPKAVVTPRSSEAATNVSDIPRALIITDRFDTDRIDSAHEQLPLETARGTARSPGTRSGLPTVAAYFACDLLSVGMSLSLMQFLLFSVGLESLNPLAEIRLAVGFTVVTLITCFYQGLYATVVLKPARELRQIWFTAMGLALLFGAIQWMVPLQRPLSLLWLVLSALAMGFVQPLVRSAGRVMFGRARWWGRRVLLVGCGENSAALYHLLQRSPVYGLRPVGYVEDFDQLSAHEGAAGYLGPVAEIAERVVECDVTLGLMVSSGAAPRNQLICSPVTGIRDWLIIAEGAGLPCLWTTPREVAGMPALGVANRLQCGWQRFGKRAIDLAIVVALAPLWVPLVYTLALLVRLGTPGKAFYAQQRLGLDGKKFPCWKLRSMVANADQVLKEYLAANPEMQAEWNRDHKLKNDPRITWIGKYLRKTSLDELPQLFNVLFGTMSLVGPRPIVDEEIPKYGDVWKLYQMVTPGITGLWQVNGRNNTTYEERLDFDDYYVRNWSLWFDLHIMICTVKVVVFREGAY